MAVKFGNHHFNENEDRVWIIFNYGPNPHTIKGTKGVVRVDPRNNTQGQNYWYTNFLKQEGDTLTFEVFTPPTIPIGLWSIVVETKKLYVKTRTNTFYCNTGLYFLCNPWNCHDSVYMPEERLLKEYILTDVGKIWNGERGREWVFGQFDACVLPAVWMMFERSNLGHSRRGDPIDLTRMISKMVNSNDDDGILFGLWKPPYIDGTHPEEWAGSVAILKQYLETGKTVRYGQCWVFAGVANTICRAIGIPSRAVTNLVSAHDKNGNLVIEHILDERNHLKEEELIWNFHVWNEVYMARPDLPLGYGGWQAIDATPQNETSICQCGPTSVEAIKKGEVGHNYDVAFMIASVNADLMTWKEDRFSPSGYIKVSCNRHHIGRFIFTKKPFVYDYNGERDREDITLNYKFPEFSMPERLALLNAVRFTEMAYMFYEMSTPENHDVEFFLKDVQGINIGEDFIVTVTVKNNNNIYEHQIIYTLSVTSVYYTGVKAKVINNEEGNLIIPPMTQRDFDLLIVRADEYVDKLVEQSTMKIFVVATVSETKQTWTDEYSLQVIKPNIKILVPDQVPVKQDSIIKLMFHNPLNKVLTNCKINMSGPTVVSNEVIPLPDVYPQGLIEREVRIKPKVVGIQQLVVTFYSNELTNITGSAKINVV